MNRNEITTPDKPSLFAQYNLVRVTSARDGAVLFDREICEVHQRRMSLTEVPVIYGLVEFSGPRPTREQWMKEFPHYQDYELGGCVVRSEKTASIYVCPDCVVAYNRWIEAKSKEANAVKASAD